MVAIPQSGLLAQVSSLRLPSGHSSQVLTLSNAAWTSLPNPGLPVEDASVNDTIALGKFEFCKKIIEQGIGKPQKNVA